MLDQHLYNDFTGFDFYQRTQRDNGQKSKALVQKGLAIHHHGVTVPFLDDSLSIKDQLPPITVLYIRFCLVSGEETQTYVGGS